MGITPMTLQFALGPQKDDATRKSNPGQHQPRKLLQIVFIEPKTVGSHPGLGVSFIFAAKATSVRIMAPNSTGVKHPIAA
jgi:hypothetical protein